MSHCRECGMQYKHWDGCIESTDGEIPMENDDGQMSTRREVILERRKKEGPHVWVSNR